MLAVGADVAKVVGTGPLVVAACIALAAGFVSFLSPCVLPLVPGYLSYVTGMAGIDLNAAGRARRRVVIGTLLFVSGFTAVFVSYGALFGGVGRQLNLHRRTVDIVIGIVTIGLGLVFAGVMSRIPLLSREFKLHRLPAAGLAGAPILGVVFGIGWTPCIGPTLGVVNGLALESATAGRGALLSAAYCFGLGVPFLAAGLAYRRALAAFAVIRRHQQVVMLAGGVLLIGLGILELTGTWTTLLIHLQSRFGGVTAPL